MLEIKKINHDKKQYMNLLLLSDEQENMIDRYLEKGEMFALYEGDLKSICVVTKEDEGVYEIKNIATYEQYQGRGYGKKLIEYILNYYKADCDTMFVGTGDSPLTIPFYKKCGFEVSHRIENFFINNYDKPIYECGKQLIDMIYLKKSVKGNC